MSEVNENVNNLVEMVDKLTVAELAKVVEAIEEKYGGTDLDFNTGLLFTEAMAPGFSFATTMGAHVSIGSLPIVYYGTKDQKEKYLPKKVGQYIDRRQNLQINLQKLKF